MIPPTCKRLIEVDFPIAKVSEHSAREKSIRHGHPSTLHLWWARRPLAACRSVLLGLLLPDPCDTECPADFKTKARQLLAKRFTKSTDSDEALRQLLLEFIGEFADWDRASNSMYLEIGRGLVKAAHPEETPVVVDPFAGGGSILLEALRLGCEAFASDLNPVACLILKTLLEDIPRYGNAEFKLPDKNGKEVLVHGLADALRHVGRQVKEAAEKELAQFYPPGPDGSRPIAYIWARTVRCEAVGCGAEIPLARSFWLSNKSGRKKALRFTIQRKPGQSPTLDFEIFEPKMESAVPPGTVSRANATCPCCHVVLPATRVRAQLGAQNGGADVIFDSQGKRNGGASLLAVVSLHVNTAGRQYRLARNDDYGALYTAQKVASALVRNGLLSESLPLKNTNCFRVPNYGVRRWHHLFNSRQLVVLAKLSGLVGKVSGTRNATSDALREILALCLDKSADLGNAFARWKPDAECPVNLFGRQAISMVWDFAEAVLTEDSSGSFASSVERTSHSIEAFSFPCTTVGQVQIADACESPLTNGEVSAWFTDPPYYDAIGYAELSDFFFVWLKRTLQAHPLLRDSFDTRNPLTPKSRECVQDENYSSEDGSPKDRDFFEKAMARAFQQGRRVLRPDGIGCVVFAHKTTEGWEALLTGMLSAGWTITASWPITTEMNTRLRARDSAALAGSVHLVCRPRLADAGTGDWLAVKATMDKRIREWLPTLLKHGIRGADAIFSCLGPALESYSRYDKVLTAADREVPLGGNPDAVEPHERGFLAYVFETLSKEALRQVLGDAETEGFEEDARMTALFLWTLQATKTNGRKTDGADNGEDENADDDEEKPKKAKAGVIMPFDTFIRITRPMGIHYQNLERRVIGIEKGVVRLLPVRERTEQLLGEAGTRPGADISLEEVNQLELGLVMKRREAAEHPRKGKRGQKAPPTPAQARVEAEFTTLDRLHRAMLLFALGRSTLLRQVLESEMKKSKRFERLALALNALYPDGSDERRMLEGVQSAMRGAK